MLDAQVGSGMSFIIIIGNEFFYLYIPVHLILYEN